MYKMKSLWSKYIIDFIEYKKSCGYKYESEYMGLAAFDKYYYNLNLTKLSFSKDIIENYLALKPNEGLQIKLKRHQY